MYYTYIYFCIQLHIFILQRNILYTLAAIFGNRIFDKFMYRQVYKFTSFCIQLPIFIQILMWVLRVTVLRIYRFWVRCSRSTGPVRGFFPPKTRTEKIHRHRPGPVLFDKGTPAQRPIALLHSIFFFFNNWIIANSLPTIFFPKLNKSN